MRKIRLAGGEPLLRKDIVCLVEKFAALPRLDELVMTTNGSQLPRLAQGLRDAGMKRINTSLDSLNAERFKRITRTGELHTVIEGIDAAVKAGFERLKLNTVVMRNRNDDEVVDLVEFAIQRKFDISFIEEMPLGDIGEHDRAEAYMSSAEIRKLINTRYALTESEHKTGGPSRYWSVDGTTSRVGFISPHSHNFCEICNRVRVTVEDRLLLCLGQEHSVDLRRVLRAHPYDDERLRAAITDSMAIKPKGHDFDLNRKVVIFRHMSVTGG